MHNLMVVDPITLTSDDVKAKICETSMMSRGRRADPRTLV